jgi:hypothetical protein
MLVAAPRGELRRSMGRLRVSCQKPNIDAAIGKTDGDEKVRGVISAL